MILTYGWRFVAVAFASFFLVHLLVTLAVAPVASAAIRVASRFGPHRAARLFLALRLLPTCVAAFAVLAVCLPGYLRWEAEPGSERVGYVFVLTAVLGASIWALSLLRLASAGRRFSRLIGERRISDPAFGAVDIVSGPAALVALKGILRPRIVLSSAVVQALNEEELSVVLRHEEAHRISRDNLKRLIMFLAPSILPSRDGSLALERCWNTFSEYAADDDAVHRDTRRSLALASALVRVARLGSLSAVEMTASTLLDESGLSLRVHRLLEPVAAAEPDVATRAPRILALVGLGLLLCAPFSYRFVQAILESLIR
ncbi:MAG: M56 family metallopeptidase [Acidobacteriota bacterium]|nr:M56 family metallopeptidase [Acidobacteriota bacterium]